MCCSMVCGYEKAHAIIDELLTKLDTVLLSSVVSVCSMNHRTMS